MPNGGDPKFWPSADWRHYWNRKRSRCKHRGIPFTLTREECLALSNELHPIIPSPNGMHLGRIDHTKGYSIDNVQWESAQWNRGKRYYIKE